MYAIRSYYGISHQLVDHPLILGHDLRPVIEALLRVKGPLLAGQALADDSGVLADEYAHFPPPASSTALAAASVSPSAARNNFV